MFLGDRALNSRSKLSYFNGSLLKEKSDENFYFLMLISTTLFARANVKIDVPGMVCQMCVFGMKKTLNQL